MTYITKKRIKNLISQFKDGTPMGWEICHCYVVFIKEPKEPIDYKIRFAIDYIGQGMDDILYNDAYDYKIDIKDLMESYRGIAGRNNLEETTALIYERINEKIKKIEEDSNHKKI